MKTIFCIFSALALGVAHLAAQLSPSDPASTNTVPASLPMPDAPPGLTLAPALAGQSADHNLWQTVTIFTNHSGRVISRKTSSYRQLGTAMNHLVNGQWQPASAEIVLTENGAAATNSVHRIAFSPDPSASDAIRLTFPSGETLSSHVSWLTYADTRTGSNHIIFSDAG